ncbi:MAG: multicopper oxidase domain-containing protein [Luteolibacter sp.]
MSPRAISAALPLLLAACFMTIGTPRLSACPWCQANPVMKPTVYEGDPDPGGKYFGQTPDPAKVRHYYLAAEPEVWDYLPEGKDPVMGNKIPPQILANPSYPKLRYRQYTDATFTTRALPDERLGILGPVMRGVTGEYIVVTLLNRLSTPVSLHPHGVRYDKDSEGSSYLTERGLGASVAPQARFTYVWYLDEASGPRPDEPSSKPWLYHSHVLGDEEINSGLSGFIVVTDAARARPDGTPADVDREMALLLQNYDESGMTESKELYEQVTTPDGRGIDGGPPPAGPPPWAEAEELRELAMRHAINGRVFGNASGMDMIEGERVRWYLFALGNEADVHTAHWHGARLRDPAGHSTDVVELMPGTMKLADMVADNPGDWMIHCHVGEHMMEGMYGHYKVLKKDSPALTASPFFGLLPSQESVRWTSAEGSFEGGRFSLKARATITAYANLPVWTTTLGLTAGKQKASIRLDRSGNGTDHDAKFRVLNVDPSGIVQTEDLQIEVSLEGTDWQNEVRNQLDAEPAKPLQLELSVDDTLHRVELPLKQDGKKLELEKR